MTDGPLHPPSLADFETIAEAAFDSLPEALARMVGGVSIQILDFPDDDTMREMELESPFDLLGLYSGIPFGEKDGGALATQPDMIFLYRRPILDYWCETEEDLVHTIRHVLIHEIGHHFGFSDADMEGIEASVPD